MFPAAIPVIRRQKVLHVDDHETFARLSCATLERHGFEAHPAYSVEQAIQMLTGESFDLMVTGCNLARSCDGVELAQEVRRRWPTLPIIMASGWRPDPIPACVDAYIPKEELFPRLVEEISRLLGRGPVAHPSR
jgi:DNA-binding response OmpR family regulator